MNKRNCIHRDIKSDNILLNHKGEVKVADFGFAVQMEVFTDKRETVVGTPYWMAPVYILFFFSTFILLSFINILNSKCLQEIINGGGYSANVDVWSVGIVLYEMAEGDPPYIDFPPLKVSHHLYDYYSSFQFVCLLSHSIQALLLISSKGAPKLTNESYWSSEMMNFFNLCLTYNEEERPTAREVLKLEESFLSFAGGNEVIFFSFLHFM